MKKQIFIITNRHRKLHFLRDILLKNSYAVNFSDDLDYLSLSNNSLYLVDNKHESFNKLPKTSVYLKNVAFIVEDFKEISTDIIHKAILLSYPLNVHPILLKIDLLFKQIKSQIVDKYEFIGNSTFAQELKNKINILAKTNTNVLITGESGTGKEIVAYQLYLNSKRASNKFIRINCSAIPDTLLESELFGYVQGAFTGADKDYEGKLLFAAEGTVFMDEIGELPLQLQSKLLRVFEENIIIPLGSNRHYPVDIRYIFATNKNLVEEVSAKRFREDLYYRINTIELKLSPLRERKEDIPYLVDYFIKKYNNKYKKTLMNLKMEDMQLLYNYEWPGNVRELENFIERMVIYSSKNIYLKIQDLLTDSKQVNKYRTLINEKSDYKSAMYNYENYLIISYLIKNGWSVVQAAKDMGIERTNLYKKIKKLGIDKNGLAM